MEKNSEIQELFKKITCKEINFCRSISVAFLPAKLTNTLGKRSSATSDFSNTIS